MANNWIDQMKPCPKCGGAPWCEVEQSYEPEHHILEVTECSKCGAKTEALATREAADAAWNRGEVQ